MDKFERVRGLIIELGKGGKRQRLADATGYTYQNIVKIEKGQNFSAEGFSKFCKYFGLDENTGLPLSEAQQAPAAQPGPHGEGHPPHEAGAGKTAGQKQSYDWLYRIDVRDLGITPPKRPKKGGKAASAGGAILTDEGQAPYTLTEAQVQVIIAMIERRYPDALAIITEILQGKRED